MNYKQPNLFFPQSVLYLHQTSILSFPITYLLFYRLPELVSERKGFKIMEQPMIDLSISRSVIIYCYLLSFFISHYKPPLITNLHLYLFSKSNLNCNFVAEMLVNLFFL